MKCDELKYYCAYRGEVIDINCDEYKDNQKYDTFYIKADVDVAIAELKDHNVQLLSENMELKQKLESVQASMYADVVDANMENRRLKEERRWRKFPEEKPSEEMEGEDFLVSNGYYSVVCEWRGYWNNEPFCGDKNCDVVKFWMPLPPAPKEADK